MRGDRGSATLEFVLVVPLVLVLLLGVVEVAIAARVQLEVTQAAREGARQAAALPDPEQAVFAAQRMLGEAGSLARVQVVRDDHVGGVASVRVVLRHRVATPIFGGFDVVLSSKSTMRVER